MDRKELLNTASIVMSLAAISITIGGLVYSGGNPFEDRPEPKRHHLTYEQLERISAAMKADIEAKKNASQDISK